MSSIIATARGHALNIRSARPKALGLNPFGGLHPMTLDATPVASTWGTGGSSAQSAHAAAIVRTGHDLAALTDHIEAQRAAAGWTREPGGTEGALAWSVWSIADAHGFPWRGVLYIARRPDHENQFMLHLAADYVGKA